jgi:hypothetical protein
MIPIIVFKGVPALVCDQCGESYADENAIDKLLQILAKEAQKVQEKNPYSMPYNKWKMKSNSAN